MLASRMSAGPSWQTMTFSTISCIRTQRVLSWCVCWQVLSTYGSVHTDWALNRDMTVAVHDFAHTPMGAFLGFEKALSHISSLITSVCLPFTWFLWCPSTPTIQPSGLNMRTSENLWTPVNIGIQGSGFRTTVECITCPFNAWEFVLGHVTLKASVLSTGGALLDALTVKVFLQIIHPVCDLLFFHPSV